jgi:hypothetical protein
MAAGSKKLTIVTKLKDQASKKMAKISKEFPRLGKGLAALSTHGPMAAAGIAAVGVAAAVATKAVIDMTNRVAQQGDQIHKLSINTGVSAETLSALKLAAEEGGSSIEVLGKGIQTLSKNIVDANRGLETYAREFRELGVDIVDAEGNTREALDVMLDVADTMKDMTSETEKSAAAQRLFGRAGKELLPMLEQGEDGIRELMERSRELGVVWSEDDAQAAADLVDAQAELSASWDGLEKSLSMDLIPLLQDLTETLTDMVQFARESEFVIPGFFGGIKGAAIGALGPLGNVLDILWDIIDAFRDTPIGPMGGLETAATKEKPRATTRPVRRTGGGGKKPDKMPFMMGLRVDQRVAENQAIIEADKKFMEDQAAIRERQSRMEADEWLEQLRLKVDLMEENRLAGMTELEILQENHARQLEEYEQFGLDVTNILAQQGEELARIEEENAQRIWSANDKKLGSYKTIASNIAQILGASQKEMAKFMIPFEIAQGVSDLAEGAWPPNPAAIAAASAHFLAAKNWADVGKKGGGGGGGGRGGGGGGAGAVPGAGAAAEVGRRGTAKVTLILDENAYANPRKVAENIFSQMKDLMDSDYEMEVDGSYVVT